MEILRLRKMTLKSTIGIGKNKLQTVQSLVNGERFGELVSLYYQLSKISYVDEVLEMLEITKEHQIEKPGKIEDRQEAKKAEKECVKRIWDKINALNPNTEEQIMGHSARGKKTARQNRKRREQKNYVSKGSQQGRNQGHYKNK